MNRPMNPRFTHSPSPRRERGMSLLELVVVIVLIGGVLAVVGGKIIANRDRANAKLADTQLKSLAGTIEGYQSDVGQYPDSLEQLITAPANATGWLGPYVTKKEDLQDPWHRPIEYRKPGDNDAPFELKSLGVDGKPGGDGVDKDIVAP
ncbi:type II secretion system major pseudopilin GspG [Arenimonas oryziterrae]|uniref:Type II secretion system core protein G n=1 Tax=Arenimonas oryziterrae DSM 21050 = YC6267 TaxID=1121015 RepID=A0A091AUR6_9GAMM|nr:type II secretion system major pseudopilin GspG [Arenimonas oryziterrae]KFN43191.1 hypothetical protein N789_11555 [Arenimonas oryziterrae DSM 21050 = YC6267]